MTTTHRDPSPEKTEEMINFNDDFYDDGLLDLVEEIEIKSSSHTDRQASHTDRVPSHSERLPIQNSHLSKASKASKASNPTDLEFQSLFNTVRTMRSLNEDSSGLSSRYKNKDLLPSKLSSDDDEELDKIKSPPRERQLKTNKENLSELATKKTGHWKNESIETDQSLLFIQDRIKEMKQKTSAKKKY